MSQRKGERTDSRLHLRPLYDLSPIPVPLSSCDVVAPEKAHLRTRWLAAWIRLVGLVSLEETVQRVVRPFHSIPSSPMDPEKGSAQAVRKNGQLIHLIQHTSMHVQTTETACIA